MWWILKIHSQVRAKGDLKTSTFWQKSMNRYLLLVYPLITCIKLHIQLLRAKRSEAKRARKRALSHVVVDEFHLQNLKIALTQKLSILEACCIEQKVFGCTCFTHIWHYFCHPEQKSTRPGLARPSRHAFERLIARKQWGLEKKIWKKTLNCITKDKH